MALKLNPKGHAHAKSLIKAGKVDKDSSWFMSADDENKILGDPPDWTEYAKWFLGIDPGAGNDTKDHYKYPFGKDGKVYRSALIAIRQRAAQQGATVIFDTAGELIKEIDGTEKALQAEEKRDINNLGPQRRTVDIEIRAVDDNPNLKELSFSSEFPVERWWGIEILDHSPKSVQLDRLKKTGSVLINHNMDQLAARVIDASISGKKGRATVEFSPSAFAQEKKQEVDAGFWRSTSVSYNINKMVLESDDNGIQTYRVTDWEPLEISLVSVPADPSVGVGRTIIDNSTKPIVKEERKKMDENEIKTKIDDARKQGGEAEAQRVKGILAIANSDDNNKFMDIALRYVENGRTVDEFKFSLDEFRKLNPQPVVDPKVTIGMNDKEIRAYSLVRAMRKLADGHKLDGIEREASDATAKICRKEARGFFIPQDVMLAEGPINPELYRAMRDMQGKRTLSVMTSASGGFLVDTEVMGGSLIELLRNKPYVAQLGATTLTGLVGNVAIPRVTGGATTYWLSESGQVTAADQAFGQLGLVPHRLVADTAYTKELLMQASIDIEAFVRNDLMTVLAIEKDRASLFGQISSGNAGEPLGIFGNTGIGSVTFGAAATWAKVLDFETQVATANALLGAMAYLTSPGVRAKWKAAVKIAGSQYSDFLWQGGNNLGEGQVNGYKAVATNQIPATGTYAHRVVFGNWADLILAEWAGIDVVVDPYSLKKQGQIEVTITLWTDIGVRHAGSFTISADSGAQ